MKKTGLYFWLQLKRNLKMLPFVLTVAVALCVGLALVFQIVLAQDAGREDKQKFKIGVVGETEDGYLGFGIEALKSFDSSRFSMEIVEMDEETAKEQLTSGEIAAYVVIPDEFVEKAVQGEFLSLRFVSTSGASSLNSLFKEEITGVISDILMASQQGVYGLEQAMRAEDPAVQPGRTMDKLAIQYIDFILDRSELCQVEILGIADNLSMPGYFLCGLLTLFLFFLSIPFAPLLIKKDMSFCRVLVSKRISAVKQVFCEYAAFFILMFVLTAIPVSLLLLNGVNVPELAGFSGDMLPLLWVRLLPYVAVVSCCGFWVFEVVSDLISGVLAQFVVSVALCYMGGCFYPISFFPDIMQKIAMVFPSGLARSYLAGCINGSYSWFSLLGLLFYFALFFGAAVAVRCGKIRKGGSAA